MHTNTNTNTNTNSLVAKLNSQFVTDNKLTPIKSIEVVKNTSDLVTIEAQSSEPLKAKQEVEKIISQINKEYQSVNKQQLDILKSKELTLQKQKNSIESQLASLNSKDNTASLIIQSLLINQTEITNNLFQVSQQIASANIGGIVGSIAISKEPVKPKKALIVVVTFITSLIIGIFGIFFYQFIRQETSSQRDE